MWSRYTFLNWDHTEAVPEQGLYSQSLYSRTEFQIFGMTFVFMNNNTIPRIMKCHLLGYQCFIEGVVLDCLNHREVKTTFLRTSLSVSANEGNM